MNLSAKCSLCLCEPVCKYKEVYQNGIEAILNATIPNKIEDGNVVPWTVKECPHIEVSIKCPHMITESITIRKGGAE